MIIEEYEVLVDYEKNLDELLDIWCCSSSSVGDGRINSENFPNKRHGEEKTTLFVVSFQDELESESIQYQEVRRKLRESGFKPADTCELLHFGIENFPVSDYIIELGSIWQTHEGEYRNYVYIDGSVVGMNYMTEKKYYGGHWISGNSFHRKARFIAKRLRASCGGGDHGWETRKDHG